jgi:hypothetical protein
MTGSKGGQTEYLLLNSTLCLNAPEGEPHVATAMSKAQADTGSEN